jgi:hypothetical protein
MSLQNVMSVSVGAEADNNQKDIRDSHNKISNDNIISQKINNSTNNFKIFEINIFSEVKNLLDLKSALEYYGISVSSQNFSSCPYHQEKTPSFRVYSGSYYCFGCGESGTIIDFVMKYFGLTAIEAVKKLNEDFRLNLPIGRTGGTAICRSSQDDKNYVDSFMLWEKQAFITVSAYFRNLKFYGEQIFINHVEYFNKYLNEVENILFVENLLNMMIENMSDFSKQVEFYRTFGEAVKLIEYKLYA